MTKATSKSSSKHLHLISGDPEKIAGKLFDDPEQRFINRELSWLAFNMRVLQEANNEANPLLERVKFLSISATNLDEFYMVRVAGLKDQVRHHVTSTSADGLTPKEQLESINELATELIHEQQTCWLSLKQELREEHIEVVAPDELTVSETDKLRHYFLDNIFPVLTPIAVDPSHPFPFVPNLGKALLFEYAMSGIKEHRIALLLVPNQLKRFIRINTRGKHYRLIAIEDVITLFFDELFPQCDLREATLCRIVRDSDLDVEEEAEDLVRYYEKAVKKRRRGRVVRLKMRYPTSTPMKQFMLDNLPASEHDVFEVEGMIDMASLDELYDCARSDLKFTPFKVRFPERINDFGGDCFAAIQSKDIVVHHPYESFDVVVQFLRQAAEDPDVVSIKQTLYRTSNDSPIVHALIEAAEAGKSVTAVVELKARFDEEANIKWARDMERAGVQVVYGFMNMKTHAKLSLVVRRVDGKLKSYAHFGTGNYHPNTAKVYTDLSYFTCDPELCQDASHLFNFITGYVSPEGFEHLSCAPHHLRQRLLALIEQEIVNAREDKPAAIWAKMNSLIDPDIIDALYRASGEGVQIDLVVRGICGIRPGVKGLSDNIRVKSLIGRFLEHARIYCFANGDALPSARAKVFMASADWMVRNFDHRVEVMVPIENETVHAQILDQIMIANLRDEKNSWALASDGTYTRTEGYDKHDVFSAHDYFMNNPSLSGRGKALRKGAKLPSDKSAKRQKKKK